MLKAIYKAREEIPEAFRELYTERGEQWEMTGVEGIKTDADVARVQEGLRKEREDHKETKTKLAAWGEMKPDEIQAKLDKIRELEAGQGTIDENKITELVDAKVATIRGPLDRRISELETANEELTVTNQTLGQEKTTRTIHDAIRTAAIPESGPKVLDSAMPDVLLLAEHTFQVEEGKVVTKDGTDPKTWLSDMQKQRGHWWGSSQGGGAGGSQGSGGPANNPWSKDAWNVTKQMQFVSEHGREKAVAAAKAAGSDIMATHPPK